MPTVTLDRDELFRRLGRTYTEDEFNTLCFDFGIELDEVTSEREMISKNKNVDESAVDASDAIVYKVDIPANRYDLLCMEGLTQALNVFLGRESLPNFHYIGDASRAQRITVKADTSKVRPFIVGAILRNVTLDDQSYESLLEVQKKLHQGLCFKRKLVAIGTHDLDTIEGPFTYDALPPEEIVFAPLRHPDKVMDAKSLFDFIDKDEGYKDIRPYLKLIRSSSVWPVVKDAKGRVCSLPPIINGDHSKISPATKNIFIECTATDLTKAKITLDTIVAGFSEYCDDKFSVERCEVVYPDDRAGVDAGTPLLYPDLTTIPMTANVEYINKGIGELPTPITAEKASELLSKMMLTAHPTDGGKTVTVDIPITRSDVLHPCDIVEDVAIAYGFNNVPARIPQFHTTGSQLPVNKLSDMIRRELAQAGFMEILTMGLLSDAENYSSLRRKDDGKAVLLGNPVSTEFTLCRTTLIPGMLKTLKANTDTKKPLKLFEVSDVVFVDDSTDTGARNERHVVVMHQDTHTSGFEIVHGVLDRLMLVLNIPHTDYKLVQAEDPTFFPGFQAQVLLRGEQVGIIGVVHPETLVNFIGNESSCAPAACFEINLEKFV